MCVSVMTGSEELLVTFISKIVKAIALRTKVRSDSLATRRRRLESGQPKCVDLRCPHFLSSGMLSPDQTSPLAAVVAS